MSGLVGSITAVSNEYNDLDGNVIKCIKIANYLDDIRRLNLQNRKISIIENSTWVPGIVTKEVTNILSGMNNMEILKNTFSIKSAAKDYEYENIKNIGNEIIKSCQ